MISNPAIEVRNLHVVYNENTPFEVVALKNFSLTVKKGEILIIKGGNGTGKSTLLNAIAGTIPVKSGEILLDGNNVTKWSALKRAKLLGLVYQDTILGTCPNLTLQENFEIVGAKKWWQPLPYRLSLTEKQIENIRQTGLPLEDRGNEKVKMFSGGQRQAITVCLNFENDRPILLFDEFTSALDEMTRSKILEYVFKRAQNKNTTIVMVMHSVPDLGNYSCTYLNF